MFQTTKSLKRLYRVSQRRQKPQHFTACPILSCVLCVPRTEHQVVNGTRARREALSGDITGVACFTKGDARTNLTHEHKHPWLPFF
jgi:hypothetical protein